ERGRADGGGSGEVDEFAASDGHRVSFPGSFRAESVMARLGGQAPRATLRRLSKAATAPFPAGAPGGARCQVAIAPPSPREDSCPGWERERRRRGPGHGSRSQRRREPRGEKP